MSPQPTPLNLTVNQLRGSCIESMHPIAAAFTDTAGNMRHQVNTPHTTTWRSAAKPFQLEVSLGSLPQDIATSLTSADIAIGAASHSAEGHHIQQLEGLSHKLGCTPDELLCGAHWPIHEETHHHLIRQGRHCSAIDNNCSGKHLYMLAACKSKGFPTTDYLDPAHPLQQEIRASIEQHTGHKVTDIVIDGCGVPCFVLPLSAMAQAWAQLGQAIHDQRGTLGRIGQAMIGAPEFVSGSDRLDLQLSHASGGSILTKVGAAGLLCGAIPHQGIGFAIKVTTGADNARPMAVFSLLSKWFPEIFSAAIPPTLEVVRNVVGRPVGHYTPHWS